MSTVVERSRYYAQIDTGDWSNIDVMQKAVFEPESLTPAERKIWLAMCTELGISPDVT